MVIMVTSVTTDEPTNDDTETRLRMRQRFQDMDEEQRKMDMASSAWVMVFFFGFLITFIGTFSMLILLEVIPLRLDILLVAGVILFGTFVMAIAGFIKGSPRIVLEDM